MLDCTALENRRQLFLIAFYDFYMRLFSALFLLHPLYHIDLLTHVPPEHCSPLEQAATVAEHLHTLLVASQNAPVAAPSQEAIFPHLHSVPSCSSPSTAHSGAPEIKRNEMFISNYDLKFFYI